MTIQVITDLGEEVGLKFWFNSRINSYLYLGSVQRNLEECQSVLQAQTECGTKHSLANACRIMDLHVGKHH